MPRKRRASRALPAPARRGPMKPEDVPVGLTLAEVQEVEGGKFDSVAESTAGVYEKHLEYFERWRKPRNINLQAVVTGHIKVYLKDMREDRGLSVSSLYCAVAAVKKALEWEGRDDQVDWDDVAKKIRSYRRKSRHLPAGVDGITKKIFETIEAAAWVPKNGEWAEKTARRAAFDLALIALMRDGLLRRSEAAAVTWGDIRVELAPGHVYGVLTIPFGKTDQYGNGEVAYIHISTLAMLHDMATRCGRDPSRADQPVFGIKEKQVANRINAACQHAGLPGRFVGHSPRVGMAMDLATYKTPLVGIMQSGRWRLPKTVVKYIRSIAAGDGAVARLHASWTVRDLPKPVAWEKWRR